MLLFVDKEYRNKIRKNRKALLKAYSDTKSPEAAAATLAVEIGLKDAQEIVAIMITAKRGIDCGISAKNHEWANKVLCGNADDFAGAGIFYCSQICPVYLNRIANDLRE
ncbi:MAG: hypothetical protein HFF08_03955 [Oscillospiraceae bacterium]|nr:hypothetical protein [Oscillospiraceae bacterium]